jgi:CBS domain-containing protein
MRARDLAIDFPTVSVDTQGLEAARLIARDRLPGLIVCDGNGLPFTVLPGSQVLRFVVPLYVQDDPHLARAYDEQASDEVTRKLGDSTVGDLLKGHPGSRDPDEIPIVDPDATTIEIAAVMARAHSPLVAVVEGGRVLGAVTAALLLDALLPQAEDRA